MPLVADSNGVILGKFTIPAGIPSGNKIVEVQGGAGGDAGSIFSGQGTLERQTYQQQTTVVQLWQSPPEPTQLRNVVSFGSNNANASREDPLAQTFTLVKNTQIAGVELYFTAAPTTDVVVQIRGTTTGLPNQNVLAEATVAHSSVVTSPAGTPTAFNFPAPVLLLGGVEYAIVVLCNDATGALAIAELGKFDSLNQRWITTNPYTVGVLLSSSNASTWTANQGSDLTFKLMEAQFTQTSTTVNLGTVAVTGATDLMLMSFADRPDSLTSVEYVLTLPDTTTLTVSDGQPVQLAAAITGNIAVSAVLTGTADFSPLLYPGAQLVAGVVATSAEYVSLAVPAGTGVDVKVIFNALLPSGANVTAYYLPAGGSWTAFPSPTTTAQDNGYVEFYYDATSVTATTVQVKLVLTGTTAARPKVTDLRVICM